MRITKKIVDVTLLTMLASVVSASIVYASCLIPATPVVRHTWPSQYRQIRDRILDRNNAANAKVWWAYDTELGGTAQYLAEDVQTGGAAHTTELGFLLMNEKESSSWGFVIGQWAPGALLKDLREKAWQVYIVSPRKWLGNQPAKFGVIGTDTEPLHWATGGPVIAAQWANTAVSAKDIQSLESAAIVARADRPTEVSPHTEVFEIPEIATGRTVDSAKGGGSREPTKPQGLRIPGIESKVKVMAAQEIKVDFEDLLLRCFKDLEPR